MRKFVGQWSSGLRVRLNPSLQSEQIGIIVPNGIISFIDEVRRLIILLLLYKDQRESPKVQSVTCLTAMRYCSRQCLDQFSFIKYNLKPSISFHFCKAVGPYGELPWSSDSALDLWLPGQAIETHLIFTPVPSACVTHSFFVLIPRLSLTTFK